MRFPNNQRGTVRSEKIPISIPKIPKGSARPLSEYQSPTTNVQVNARMARSEVTMTKQSPAAKEYASIN